MIIETKYFGEMEIDSNKIITFPEGILGLEALKKYMIFEMHENPKFQWLQSLDQAEICFLLVNPWDFLKGYEMDISDEELESINVESIEQIAVYNIVTLAEDIAKSTVNFLAPLIVNAHTKVAAQIVLREDKYHTKHPIFSKEGDASC